MMKKKLALVLAMAMTASLALTGCGNGNGSVRSAPLRLWRWLQHPRRMRGRPPRSWPPAAPLVLTMVSAPP